MEIVKRNSSQLIITIYPIYAWLWCGFTILSSVIYLAKDNPDGVFFLGASLIAIAFGNTRRFVFNRVRRRLTMQKRSIFRLHAIEYSLVNLNAVNIRTSAGSAGDDTFVGSRIELEYKSRVALPLTDYYSSKNYRSMAIAIADFLDVEPGSHPALRKWRKEQPDLSTQQKSADCSHPQQSVTRSVRPDTDITDSLLKRVVYGVARPIATFLLMFLGLFSALVLFLILSALSNSSILPQSLITALWIGFGLICTHFIVVGLIKCYKVPQWLDPVELFCSSSHCAVRLLLFIGAPCFVIGSSMVYSAWGANINHTETELFFPMFVLYIGVRLPLRALRIFRAGALPPR